MENIDYVPDWAKKAIIYHIYPLGFFNAPKYRDQENKIINRLENLRNYYNHFQKLGTTVIQFGPLFESTSHGYDTINFLKIDQRLGTNDLFQEIVKELHEINIRVILDGVFNHVGREFFTFQDIQQNGASSNYLNWHFVDFKKNNLNNDGFDYKNWEGNYSLVKLNLSDSGVKNFLFQAVQYWLKDVGIDGWRLDVAYLIPLNFWKEFRKFCLTIEPECLLVGELIHGPYNKWVNREHLHVGTDYQVYKSIYSALNDRNIFELKAVLENSYHPQWGQIKDQAMMIFLGNHDTTRIRSILNKEQHLRLAFFLLLTLRGIPKIYYGDELGMIGVKTEKSDCDVRRPMVSPNHELTNKDLFQMIVNLIKIRKSNHALIYGSLNCFYADSYKGQTMAFLRQSSKQTLLVIINADSQKKEVRIPLWNINLAEDQVFSDIIQKSNPNEYQVKNNHLSIEIDSCWGRILEMK